MTDSAVAEGQVKLRDGKKWKSRWLVLRKPSPVADCLLMLVFKDKSEKSKGHKERSSVTLEDICGLEPGLSLEGVNHILAIICLGQTVLLAFDNKETMCAWDMRTRYSLGEVHRFHVSVLPGTKLESGPATLHFCNNIFVLVRDVPPTIIGQWKLSDMRRYGAIPNGFVFEGGSRCGIWAGVFCLSCTEGERISFLFDCIVRGISPTKGPFGLRPVLPDPSLSPAYMEEKISHEALELEKRLSLLSQSSRQSSGGDDRSLSSSTESSDTSQSDSASMGSRLTLWPEQLSVSGLQEGHAPGPPGAARGLGPAEEKLYAEVVRGSSKPPPKPPRSRKLQEVGRQSSSDSGIATASHSSYSGSFSSYAGSLDVCQSDEFGSLLSLPSNVPAERTLCTCEAPTSTGSEYQVPSSIWHHYDTPRSVLQAAAVKEAPPVSSLPSVLKDQAPQVPQEMADSQLAGTERGKSFPSVLEGARDPTGEPYVDSVSRWTQLKLQGQTPDAPGSEGPSLSGTAMPGMGSTDPCEMCSPYPGMGRALFTACLTCGGLKGTMALQSGTASIPTVPGSGRESREKACINKLHGLTAPRNNQYKEFQRMSRSTSQTQIKQGGNWHNSDGDIYGTLWDTRSRCLKDVGSCQFGVAGTRCLAPWNDSSADRNIFSRSHSMDDRLNVALERRATVCDELRAHSKTFARSQQLGGWLSHATGHRSGQGSSAPAEKDVYETMSAAQRNKSGWRGTVSASRSLGSIYDLWRKLGNIRDTYNVINDSRKLLSTVGKVRTFPGTGGAVTRHSGSQGNSPNIMAQPYVFIEAPVQEHCVPEGCKPGGDCWRYTVKDAKSSKSSTWSSGRQQASPELNWKDHQPSALGRGFKELAASNDNALKAEVFESREVYEDKKPNKKEEKLKMVAGQMYEFMEALPAEKQLELEKGSGYEYMASCGQQKLLAEGEGVKLHRPQEASLDIVGLKQKREKGFPEDEGPGSFDTKKLPGGAFAYPLELISGSDRPRPTEGATYVNIPVSPASKKQLHYMELELQEPSPAIRGASSSKYAQIDITATETAHKVGTQHAQHREERLQELEQKRKGPAPQ